MQVRSISRGNDMVKREWPSFDELKRMAETSPERLEAFRINEIEALIAQAPEHLRRRLRGLQFQVNSQRRLHKSPMGSCVAISRMMHDSLLRLQAVLHRRTVASNAPKHAYQDNVIPFAG